MAGGSEWDAFVYGYALGMDEGFDENPAHRIQYVDAPFTPFEKVALSIMCIVAMSIIGCVVGVSLRSCARAHRRRLRIRHSWVLPALDDATDVEAAGGSVLVMVPSSSLSGELSSSPPQKQPLASSKPHPPKRSLPVVITHPDDHISLGTR